MTDPSLAPPSIHAAMAAVMLDVGAVGKGGRNKEQGYNFRGIDQLMNAMHPAMVAHGVYCTPEVLSVETEYRATKSGGVSTHRLTMVRFTFYGPAGDSVSCTTVGEGADSYDKSSNKALSGAYKYALTQVFCIPLDSEKDADSESPDMGSLPAPPQQVADDEQLERRKAQAQEWADTIEGTSHEAEWLAWKGKHPRWFKSTNLFSEAYLLLGELAGAAKADAGEEPFDVDPADDLAVDAALFAAEAAASASRGEPQ